MMFSIKLYFELPGSSVETAAAIEVTSPWMIPQVGYEVLNSALIAENPNLSSVVPDTGMLKLLDLEFKKKTTYALKTPRVVALPFIYGVEYIILTNQK